MDKSFKLSFLDVFLPSELADKGVLVGSRAQGVSKTQDNELNESIKFFVTPSEITYLINFIFVVNQETYNAWIKATEVLKIVGDAFTTKQNRIKVFCDLVVYFGGGRSKYPNFCS